MQAQQKKKQKILKQLEDEQHIAQWSVVHKEIREEMNKLLEFNQNENTTSEVLSNTAKAILRGKFIPWIHILKTLKYLK
jgi:hypothetical protein